MKKTAFIIILTVFSSTVFAQWGQRDRNDEDPHEINTLLGNHNITNGGYGGFGAGYSNIDGKDAIVMNARAAWIINHSLGIGFSGSGFINDFHYDRGYDDYVNLTGGYGGVLIEPILFPRFPFHLAFPVVAGVGGIAYTTTEYVRNRYEYGDTWVEDTETFLIFEPGAELEINVLRFFRMAIGMSYRMTTDINLIDTPVDVLDGFTTGISFKFGKF